MNLVTPIYLFSLLAALVLSEEIPKRTPIGFSGVRGKKFSFLDYDLPEDRFLTSRVEPFDVNNEDRNAVGTDEDIISGGKIENVVDERVPLMMSVNRFLPNKKSVYGFVGMRGKKLSDAWFRKPNESLKPRVSQYDQKRTPYAFLGMRGKKKEKFSSYYKTKDQYGDKRAPMGFIGMRGKKSYFINDSAKTD